jgi:hypothetical protein
MDNKVKAVLIAGIVTASMWLYFRYQKPTPGPPKKEPTYLVMAKRFIDRSSGYYIQYKLLGVGEVAEVLAQCDDPKPDGTGCEKYKTWETYGLEKDASGRFLFDRKAHGVYLTIKAEGSWSKKDDRNWSDDADE